MRYLEANFKVTGMTLYQFKCLMKRNLALIATQKQLSLSYELVAFTER